jgi:hypothetical protein
MSSIKRIVIPFSELPGADSQNFSYNVRYRIISDDKNRVSHWSRIYNIDASIDVDGNPVIPALVYSTVNENAVPSGGGVIETVRLNWQVPAENEQFRMFDIFLKRCASGACSEAYEYLATTTGNNYTVAKSGSETHFQFLVQTPVYPKEVTASAQLFETDPITI